MVGPIRTSISPDRSISVSKIKVKGYVGAPPQKLGHVHVG